MRRHIPLITTIFLGLGSTAACGSGSAEEGRAQGGAERAVQASASGGEAGTTAQETSCFLRGATPEEAQGRTSPLRQLRFTLAGGEGAEVLLCYGAPSARGREILGGLVPYEQPWRAGANEATAIHLTGAASIGGVVVEPGSYSLYTIPGEEEWQFFLNSNWQRWGIPINDAVRETEVGRFTVRPETTAEAVETLTFRHADGAIVMEWENTRLSIPVGEAES